MSGNFDLYRYAKPILHTELFRFTKKIVAVVTILNTDFDTRI